MAATYILILVYTFGYGPRTTVFTQEFSTQETCVAAQIIVSAGFKKARDDSYIQQIACIKK